MKTKLWALILFLLLSTACRLPFLRSPTPEPAVVPQEAAITVNPTLFPPTATPEGMSPAPVSTPASESSVNQVNVYLIAMGDQTPGNHVIGCGDSLIPVTVDVAEGADLLVGAYNQLLSIRDSSYGETDLYNSLYQSSLAVDRVELVNGNAAVHLNGTLMLGGTCDTPRIEGQLEAAALQFSDVTSVEIFVNGQKLEELFSTQ